MKRFPFLLLATVLVLAACDKKEAATTPEKSEGEAKKPDNLVTLTPEQLEHSSIKLEVAAKGELERTIKASGRVSVNLNKTAKVGSTLDGRITKLNADINDPVKTGDVLAQVQTPELIGRPLELKAPIDGVIMERNQGVGELVEKAGSVYTISDPTSLWVLAEVKERDLAALQVGQAARFSVLAYPDSEFEGKVVRLGNRVEDESRTVEARIDANNADGRLKPGMFADVEITTTIVKGVLVISDRAVQTNEDAQIVFVALGEGKFEKRDVKLGMEQHGRVQILEGVKEGELVVTEGSFILKSEMLKSQLADED